MTEQNSSIDYPSKKPISRRQFVAAAGTVALAATVARPSAILPPADAQTSNLLPLLSDFSSVMPPTQVTAKCIGPGALDLWWLPGSAPAGTLRYQIYVNGMRFKNVGGITASLTGLPTTGPSVITLASESTDNTLSETTCGISRSVGTADNDQDNRPVYFIGERAFGGVQLRWVHGGPGRNIKPTAYVVLTTSESEPLATVDGSTTFAFISNLSIGTEIEIYLEARTDGQPTREARNRVRVTPYGRQLNTDRTPPSAPTKVSINIKDSGLLVRWNASADSGSGVYCYKVFVNDQLYSQVRSSTSTGVGPLKNDVKYAVTVSAVDLNGNESARSTRALGTPRVRTGSAGAMTSPRFTNRGSAIVDPEGRDFVPIGANVNGPDFNWTDATVGASAATAVWKWNAVRVNCGMRDGPSSQGYRYFVNNQVDVMVREYTEKKVVLMLNQHSHLGSPAGQNLPTETGSAGDPSGRSTEVAITDWWVEVAKRYGDNPYVWFNLVNEPGSDRAALDAQYRRMVSRVRAVAPMSVIVLDAAAFANDIPTNTSAIRTGPLDENYSFVLSNGPSLVRDFGPGAGYGPIVFSVHLYARWAVNWGPGGLVTADQLAARIRDYVTRTKAAGLPLVIGELGVESYAIQADTLCVQAALYTGGKRIVNGVEKTTGVLVEQQIGVFPWHVARTSGMSVALPSKNWNSVTSRSDTNPSPQAGTGLWDMVH